MCTERVSQLPVKEWDTATLEAEERADEAAAEAAAAAEEAAKAAKAARLERELGSMYGDDEVADVVEEDDMAVTAPRVTPAPAPTASSISFGGKKKKGGVSNPFGP
jgi:hypothetical protein